MCSNGLKPMFSPPDSLKTHQQERESSCLCLTSSDKSMLRLQIVRTLPWRSLRGSLRNANRQVGGCAGSVTRTTTLKRFSRKGENVICNGSRLTGVTLPKHLQNGMKTRLLKPEADNSCTIRCHQLEAHLPLTWLQSEITFLIFLPRMNTFKLHSYHLNRDTQTLKVKTHHLTPYLIPSVKVLTDVQQQQQQHSSRNLRGGGGGRLCDEPKERLRKRIGLCEVYMK